MQFKDVQLKTRRALSPYKVYGDSALLVLEGTSLNSANVLLALNRRICTPGGANLYGLKMCTVSGASK